MRCNAFIRWQSSSMRFGRSWLYAAIMKVLQCAQNHWDFFRILYIHILISPKTMSNPPPRTMTFPHLPTAVFTPLACSSPLSMLLLHLFQLLYIQLLYIFPFSSFFTFCRFYSCPFPEFFLQMISADIPHSHLGRGGAYFKYFLDKYCLLY